MKSRFLVYSLLLSFGFLLIPRVYWHDCTEKHADLKHNGKSIAHFDKGACFICDFQLYPADISQKLELAFQKTSLPVTQERAVSLYQSQLLHQSNRGPPAF